MSSLGSSWCELEVKVLGRAGDKGPAREATRLDWRTRAMSWRKC